MSENRVNQQPSAEAFSSENEKAALGMPTFPEFGLVGWGGPRFLVKPEGAPEKKGEIIVEQAPPPVGVVVDPDYAAGRRVLFRKYSGTKAKIDGEEYLILDAEHVLLWLPDDAEVEDV